MDLLRLIIVSTYPLLGLLFHVALFIQLFFALVSVTLLAVATFFLCIAVCQAAEQLARFRGHAVYSVGVDLDATIQCAAGLLEIDAVALFEQ